MIADISVVVPTFRRPVQLHEALISVLSQKGVTSDVLVIDDSPEGSARDTVERLADERVRYTQRAAPSGGKPALVRNEGWPQTVGRFVHFLDDDDRVAEGAHRAMVDKLDANPKRGVVFGRIDPFGEDAVSVAEEERFFRDGANRARLAGRTGSRRWMVANMLFKSTVLVNSACMIRRECLGPLGGYNPRLSVVEDVEFYVRAIRRFGCVFLDRLVLHYRILPDSLMHREKDNTAVLESYRLMYDDYRENYGATELFLLRLFTRSILSFL